MRNNGRPIIMTGLWTPENGEASRLVEYTRGKQRNGFRILYVNGRQPFVSFLLAGRSPVESIKDGETYFVNIKGDLMSDEQRVRRVIRVYPVDDDLPENLPNVDLEYLLRPLTVFECWRAARRPVSLVRQYRPGIQDRMKKVAGGGAYRISLVHGDDRQRVHEDQLPWDELQYQLDDMDDATRETQRRPDWRLVSPLRAEGS